MFKLAKVSIYACKSRTNWPKKAWKQKKKELELCITLKSFQSFLLKHDPADAVSQHFYDSLGVCLTYKCHSGLTGISFTCSRGQNNQKTQNLLSLTANQVSFWFGCRRKEAYFPAFPLHISFC